MPLESTPLISVIVPTYNAARYLPEALESVRRTGYSPLEIIVVDDGSTDGTPELARQWPDVRYRYQSNAGPSAARNAGIDMASADLLAFIDADDLWTADHFERLLPPLLADPSLRFVFGTVDVIRLHESATASGADHSAHSPPDQQIEQLHERLNAFLIGAGLYRRAAFEQVGRFDPAMRMGEDLDWIATARHKQAAHVQIAEPVMIYRRRAGSLTDGKTFHELNVMTALRRSIERHRANRSTADGTAALRKAG
ncbi:MAG: glycosyltransferase family 2 protein [Planctomycetia bacterium]|nr:glycosyltransferase family 2 protein [Planctomycetia bacterium]